MDKVCPTCGAEVPKVAKRCKDCFHDFESKSGGGGIGWAGPIALLGALAGMVVVANITLLWIVSRPQDQHIQILKTRKNQPLQLTLVLLGHGRAGDLGPVRVDRAGAVHEVDLGALDRVRPDDTRYIKVHKWLHIKCKRIEVELAKFRPDNLTR